MSKDKVITLLSMNVVEIYDHVSRKKIAAQFQKNKIFYLNYYLNEQFHVKSTHHSCYKQRYDDNEQCQRRSIARFFNFIHIVFVL